MYVRGLRFHARLGHLVHMGKYWYCASAKGLTGCAAYSGVYCGLCRVVRPMVVYRKVNCSLACWSSYFERSPLLLLPGRLRNMTSTVGGMDCQPKRVRTCILLVLLSTAEVRSSKKMLNVSFVCCNLLSY